MKKRWKRLAAVAVGCVMTSSMAVGMAGCGGGKTTTPPSDIIDKDDSILNDGKNYTLNQYTSESPSAWNELNYQSNEESVIIGYTTSNFFNFDFEYDADGNIVEGGFQVQYSAVTAVKDVTADYSGFYDAGQIADGGYAWEFKLRTDLKWDDGTAIKAGDFVYSMKAQLDPRFNNYRADSYYNSSTVIRNARNYFYQGKYGYSNMISTDYGDDEYVGIDDMTETSGGTLQVNGADVVLNINDGGNWGDTGLNRYYKDGAFGYDVGGTAEEPVYTKNALGESWEALAAKADEDGYIKLNKEDVAVLCDIIAVLHEYADAEAYAVDAGGYAYLEWEEFCYFGALYSALDFSEVGIKAKDDYTLVIILEKALYLTNDDGSLSYRAAYNFSGLPLVKKDLYEKCAKAPTLSGGYYTSTYNTSVATSASWGPYKMTFYQTGKQYIVSRNENWYGYTIKQYQGQYQADTIVTETIEEYNTAFTLFLAGNIDFVGINTDNAEKYKTSDFAYFTPDDSVQSLHLQSRENALSKSSGSILLKYQDFRKAISLGIDRFDYATTITTSGQAAFSIFSPIHYYDVENGGAYLQTEVSKRVRLGTYGFTENQDGTWTDGTHTYMDIDEATDAITGYNLAMAGQLFKQAYEAAVAAGDLSDGQVVTLTLGTLGNDSQTEKEVKYFEDMFARIATEAGYSGKLKIKQNSSYTDTTSAANGFRNGTCDILRSGWTGGAWDPAYFLLAYLSPSYMYSAGWDTSSATMTYAMPAGDYNGAGETYTMNLMNWYRCLNGTTVDGDTYKFNWSSGVVTEDIRLGLVAALENEILQTYYTLPILGVYGASLHSRKVDYVTYSYNTFMSYGGIRFMQFNYTDEEWSDYVSSHKVNGELNYITKD